MRGILKLFDVSDLELHVRSLQSSGKDKVISFEEQRALSYLISHADRGWNQSLGLGCFKILCMIQGKIAVFEEGLPYPTCFISHPQTTYFILESYLWKDWVAERNQKYNKTAAWHIYGGNQSWTVTFFVVELRTLQRIVCCHLIKQKPRGLEPSFLPSYTNSVRRCEW